MDFLSVFCLWLLRTSSGSSVSAIFLRAMINFCHLYGFQFDFFTAMAFALVWQDEILNILDIHKLNSHRKPDLMSRILTVRLGNRAERWRKVRRELKQWTEYVKEYVNGPQSIRDSTETELENKNTVAKARCSHSYFVDSFATDFVLLLTWMGLC